MSSDDKRTYRDWRAIAEQVAKEADPGKLRILVEELCSALDHQTRPQEQGKPVNKKNNLSD